MPINKFRTRIYAHYLDSGNETGVPRSIADFADRAPTMRHAIKSFFPTNKGAAILDIGCGHGALLYFARQDGCYNAKGVDVSVQQVSLAKQVGKANPIKAKQQLGWSANVAMSEVARRMVQAYQNGAKR